jgi:hypothetical protein
MAIITVIFNDGTPDFKYRVESYTTAKTYALCISTGKGCRKRENDDLIYFPLHKIDKVKVTPEPGEKDQSAIYERKKD